jgi:hypothetical protein
VLAKQHHGSGEPVRFIMVFMCVGLSSGTCLWSPGTDGIEFADNLQYALDTCIFTSPSSVSNATSSCSTACNPLGSAMMPLTSGLLPNDEADFAFCGADQSAFSSEKNVTTCTQCLRTGAKESYMANCECAWRMMDPCEIYHTNPPSLVIATLEAGCAQQTAGKPLILNGTIFSSVPVALVSLASSASQAADEGRGLKTPVIIGIAVGGSGALLVIIGLVVLFCCCRRKRKHPEMAAAISAPILSGAPTPVSATCFLSPQPGQYSPEYAAAYSMNHKQAWPGSAKSMRSDWSGDTIQVMSTMNLDEITSAGIESGQKASPVPSTATNSPFANLRFGLPATPDAYKMHSRARRSDAPSESFSYRTQPGGNITPNSPPQTSGLPTSYSDMSEELSQTAKQTSSPWSLQFTPPMPDMPLADHGSPYSNISGPIMNRSPRARTKWTRDGPESAQVSPPLSMTSPRSIMSEPAAASSSKAPSYNPSSAFVLHKHSRSQSASGSSKKSPRTPSQSFAAHRKKMARDTDQIDGRYGNLTISLAPGKNKRHVHDRDNQPSAVPIVSGKRLLFG